MAEELYASYLKDVAANPESVFLMHFRYATHGAVKIKNCHPFAIPGGAMIHNGILHIDGLPDGTSDSGFLARNIVSKFPDGWQDQKWWVDVLDTYIGYGNKLAFLFDDNRFLIVGEKRGKWKDGVWYSNESYCPLPKQQTTTQTKRVIHNADGTVYVSGQPWQRPTDDDMVDLYDAWYGGYQSAKEPEEGQKVLTFPTTVSHEDQWDWCEDCYEELTDDGEEHVCNVPEYVMRQFKENVEERRSVINGRAVNYGIVR